MVWLTDLADVLRRGGLTVIEEPGWRTRGHGPMTDVKGVTCHHTANGGASGLEPSRRVIRDGRPGLEGPLSQLLLRTDGVVRVIAAGLCYHAGVSRETDQTNSHRIGIEAEAQGTGARSDWPPAQMAAYALACKVLMKHYRFSISEVLGHKETCSPRNRKTDPTFNMDDFRSKVVLATRPTADVKPAAPTKQEVPTMELKDNVTLSAAAAKAMGKKEGDKVSVNYLLQWGGAGAYRELNEIRALSAQVKGQQALLSTIASAVSALATNSPEAVRQAFAEGVAELKSELADIDVRVVLGDDLVDPTE